MKTINYRGVDQSGVNCKGFTLVCNFGYYYLACKVEHTPEDPWLGLPVADFFSSTVFGEQFLYALNPLKNDNDIIGRLFYYLDGEQYQQNNHNQHHQIEFIAQQLHQRNLLIYPLQDKKRLFSNLHFPPPPKITKKPLVIVKIDKECFFRNFSITCKHTSRGYTHEVLNSDNKSSALKVVGVDTITVKANTKCGYNKPDCASVYLNGPEFNNKLIPSGESFEVKPPMKKLDSKVLTVMGAIQQLPFGKKPLFTSYSLVANGCDSNLSTFIQSYDSFSWTGQFAVIYDKDKKTDNWRIENNLSGEIAGNSWKVENKNHIFTKMMNGLNNVIQGVATLEAESGNTSDTEQEKSFLDFLVPPKLKIGGNITLNEKINSPEVVYDGNLKLDFDPLIGLNFKFDVVDYLIMYFMPGVGAAVSKARNKIAAGIGTDGTEAKAALILELSAEATLSAYLAWEFKDGICTIPPKKGEDTKVGVLLGVKLLSEVSGEITSFFATIKFVAKVEMKGVNHPAVGLALEAYEAVVDNEPSIHYRGLWTGIKIETTTSAEAAIGSDEFKNERAATQSGNSRDSVITKAKTTKYDDSYDSFSFGSLPPSNSGVDPETLSYTGHQKVYPHGPSIFDSHIIFDSGGEGSEPKVKDAKYN